ncbi:unnamed protein product [Dovyalis caffra]|uniref:Uncharacterized protein n=1 Tax=Dovyalis caffra TaxID=77055 RepID=A0AAV1QZ37_9ROSI|nr:unnamed protein product [Dovyalis caffra]
MAPHFKNPHCFALESFVGRPHMARNYSHVATCLGLFPCSCKRVNPTKLIFD